MPFSFRCLLGHDWDGCVCRRCNPEAEVNFAPLRLQSGWRNRGHDLDGCFCRRCRLDVHDWDGCVCRRCEATRAQEHDRRGTACARCGAAVEGTREVACAFCGGTGTVYGPTSGQGGDPCGCGGGVVLQEVWGAPADACVRPRPRPGLESRLAGARGDGTVVALARGIRESEDWSGFGPLHDALMEAGCADEEVLNHCRRGGHSPDCWVLRALLEGSRRQGSENRP
jgi:hypothetical protein